MFKYSFLHFPATTFAHPHLPLSTYYPLPMGRLYTLIYYPFPSFPHYFTPSTPVVTVSYS